MTTCSVCGRPFNDPLDPTTGFAVYGAYMRVLLAAACAGLKAALLEPGQALPDAVPFGLPHADIEVEPVLLLNESVSPLASRRETQWMLDEKSRVIEQFSGNVYTPWGLEPLMAYVPWEHTAGGVYELAVPPVGG